MPTKRRSPPKHFEAGSEIAREASTALVKRAANGLEIDAKTGRFKAKLTDENIMYALERLMSGDTMRNVTEELGISRSALFVRAHSDPEFKSMLQTALEMGTWSLVENTLLELQTTDDPAKTRALADFVKWYAARVARGQFGDKVQVDANILAVTVVKDDLGLG
jgi:hypothetical protein